MNAKPTPDMPAQQKIFSYPINISDVPQSGLDISIEADAATLAALAVADGLPNIARLEATFHVVPIGSHRFNVSGEVHARVTQICGVSLEPFESDLVEPVDIDFATAAEAAAAAAAYAALIANDAVDPALEADPPDPITDGKIDLGVLASEFLTLGLDPYPRKPGVNFEPPGGQDADAAEESPFSILRKLKERP
ncbi:MAG: YceD family protein [Methylovirgula sp.]